MNGARLVVLTNGPGEFMGWARPFVRALYERDPGAQVTIAFVPCPYATGHEPQLAAEMFPRARVVDAKTYGRFLLGRKADGLERGPGAVQYLGGDLFHATTVARRLGMRPMTYKFAGRNYARSFERCFALDESNARRLRAEGAPPERVRIVGNLVADAVLGSVQSGACAADEGGAVCFMPGSRPHEVRFLTPFFVAAAVELARSRPDLRVTFVLSPFNSDDEMRQALALDDDPLPGSIAGKLVDNGAAIEAGGARFAVDRSTDYSALSRAQLVVTIPGTKCIECAVLGRPLLVVLPRNRLDKAVINGVGNYLDRVPVVGRPLKAWLAGRVERGFRFVAQPNIDADRMIAAELRAVLTPRDIAARALELLAAPDDLRAMGDSLARVYAADAGAARRMADEALAVAGARPVQRTAAAG